VLTARDVQKLIADEYKWRLMATQSRGVSLSTLNSD
jgi:hypothetical protein